METTDICAATEAISTQDDDGFKLFESRAICRYIAAKYASPTSTLIPTDLKAHAIFEQAASIETSYFNTPAGTILYEKVVKKCASFLGLHPKLT